IPFLGIILGMGVTVLLLAVFDILPEFLVLIYGKIIDALQFVVRWVADKDYFLIEHVYFSFEMLLLSCLVLSLLAFSLYRKQKIYAFLFWGALIAFQLDFIRE